MQRFSFLNRAVRESVSESRSNRRASFTRTVASAVISLSAFAVSAKAAIITYAPPTIVGAQVTYPDVSESSSTNPVPLYGAPSISGNDLVFSNLNFAAVSTNGSGLDFVDGQLNFTLQADPGNFLTSLDLTENGDYNVTQIGTAVGPNTAEAFEDPVQITLLGINGLPVTPVINNTADTMIISPDNGLYTTGVNPDPGSFTGAADVNLAAIFGSNQITEIAVSYDDQLAASSQLNGIADIAKKGFDVIPFTTPGTQVMPEPTVASLLLLTLGVGLSRRRNRGV